MKMNEKPLDLSQIMFKKRFRSYSSNVHLFIFAYETLSFYSFYSCYSSCILMIRNKMIVFWHIGKPNYLILHQLMFLTKKKK